MARSGEGIRAVAAAAGVSVTTVSHALSGRGHVSALTRLKVEEAAARLGYAPNRIASALRSQRTQVMGFISEEIATTPFAGKILLGAQDAAAELGLMLMIINIERDATEHDQIDALLAQQVDATIFASSSHRQIQTPLSLDPRKTVLVDAFDRARSSPSVVPDEVGIGLMATRRLLDSGHTHIVHISVDEKEPSVDGRGRGYFSAMSEAGLRGRSVTAPGPADAEAGRRATRQAIQYEPELTAVFAFNDQMAMGVYQELSLDPRITIPREVSVVGVDDLELVAGALVPGLTTVALPHVEMGRLAVEIAAQARNEYVGHAPVVRLPGRLVERGSVSSRSTVTDL